MESNLLRVNLTTGEIKNEIIGHEVFERWVGGSGVNNWIMWDHFLTHDINCDPAVPVAFRSTISSAYEGF